MIFRGTLKDIILDRLYDHDVQFKENMRAMLFDEIKDDAKYLEIEDSDDRFINLATNILTYMLDFGGEEHPEDDEEESEEQLHKRLNSEINR